MVKRKRTFIKILISIFLVLIIIGSIAGYKIYKVIYEPNVRTNGEEHTFLFIKSDGTYNDVLDSLYSKNLIVNKASFEWLAKKKNYSTMVKPGRYLINDGMSNNELINMLRSGKQKPIKLIFNNIRTKEQFADRISKQIEADSLSIINILNNNPLLEKYGLFSENVLVMFLPNTYEFFWNTSAEQFIERMHKEYLKFWNDERLEKASSIGLTAVDISILASIVQSETNKKDEMARIAGVYINRINKGMLLQADPTVVFAWGDFSINRVLYKHLEIDSPYNTYKYAGLPPGPITIPEPYTIDKVLNYEKHNFLFFCAHEELTGYHVFAESLSQHSINAKKYQNALSKLKKN